MTGTRKPLEVRPGWTAAWLFLGVLLVYLSTAAGHITSSDGHTMFVLTESLLERRTVAVPEGNAEPGPDGRLYPKAGLGLALASTPFYVAGRLAAGAVEPPLRSFVVKGVTSMWPPFAGALTALLLFWIFLELGLTPRESVVLTVVGAFGTPLWVYARLFLAESALALGLTLLLYGVVRAHRGGGAGAGLAVGCGFGFAVLTKYAILPAALLLAVAAVPALRRPKFALAAVLSALAFLALAGLYNEARTGSWLGTGYGRQGTMAAFTTPIAIGLYGLLLSSGKGLLWFAPIVALVPASFVAWRRQQQVLALAGLAAVVCTLCLYATFEHWAGDGSWGPRYLVPLVPLLLVAVGARLAERTLPRPRAWWIAVVALGVAGIAVQKGGVFIAVGAEMREVGDYPYELPLSDPRFMSDSHWNPHVSPIAVHWQMLGRNLEEHLRGEWPRLEVGSSPDATESRHGISGVQIESLTHGFDVWAAYAIYAGREPSLLLPAWFLLLFLGLVSLWGAWREGGRAAPTGRRAVRASPSEPPAKPSVWSST